VWADRQAIGASLSSPRDAGAMSAMSRPLQPGVLILVENLSVPFDRRVWLEATTLRDAGFRVSVICPRGAERDRETRVEVEGIAIYRYDLPAGAGGAWSYAREYGLAIARTLALSIRVYRERGFRVIHGCNPPDLFFAIALLYRPLGVRYVFDQHDLSPETFLVRFGGRLAAVYRLLLVLERWTFRTAHTVIATNQSLRDIALRRGRVPADRVFVVRTGPDFGRLRRVPPEPVLRWGHRFLVVYLGVMGPQDGVDLAIRAASIVVHARGRQDVGFVFVGDGDYAPALRSMCADLGLDEHAHFTGRVPDDTLVRYLSTADVCVSPDPANNLNEFHTMNKTMEYMAMGKAVVAFDLKETRYSAGDAAAYVSPNDVGAFADEIIALLDDAERREAMGQAGLRRVRSRLSWDHSKPALLAAYAHAFGDSRLAAPYGDDAAV